MSRINVYQVINDANNFTSNIILEQIREGKVSEEDITKIYSGQILSSGKAKDYVDNVIVGAIMCYHDQLRAVLSEKGIDIGELIVE